MAGSLKSACERGSNLVRQRLGAALAIDAYDRVAPGDIGLPALSDLPRVRDRRRPDVRGAQRIMVFTLLIMIASCLPLPLSRAVPWLLWIIAFVWGAAGGCLYTLAITGMAQRFSGTKGS